MATPHLGKYSAISFEQFLEQFDSRLKCWQTLPPAVRNKQYGYVCKYLEASPTASADATREQWEQLTQKVVCLLNLNPFSVEERSCSVNYINAIAGRLLAIGDDCEYAPLRLFGPEGERAVVPAPWFDKLGEQAKEYRIACGNSYCGYGDGGIPLDSMSKEAFQALLGVLRGAEVPCDLPHGASLELFAFAHRVESSLLQKAVAGVCMTPLRYGCLGSDFAKAQRQFKEVIQPIAAMDADTFNLMVPHLNSYYQFAYFSYDGSNMTELLEGAFHYAANPWFKRGTNYEAAVWLLRYIARTHHTFRERSARMPLIACNNFCSLLREIDRCSQIWLPTPVEGVWRDECGIPFIVGGVWRDECGIPFIDHLLANHSGQLFEGSVSDITTALEVIRSRSMKELAPRAVKRLLAEWPTLSAEKPREDVLNLQKALLAMVPTDEPEQQQLIASILQLQELTPAEWLLLELLDLLREKRTVADIARVIDAVPSLAQPARDAILADVATVMHRFGEVERSLPVLLSIQDPLLFQHALRSALSSLGATRDEGCLFLNSVFAGATDPLQKNLARALLLDKLRTAAWWWLTKNAGEAVEFLSSLDPALQDAAKMMRCVVTWSRNTVVEAIEASFTDPSLRTTLHEVYYPELARIAQLPEDRVYYACSKMAASLISDWGLLVTYHSVVDSIVSSTLRYLGYMASFEDPANVLKCIDTLDIARRDRARAMCALARAADDKADGQLFLDAIDNKEARSTAAAWVQDLLKIQPTLYRAKFVWDMAYYIAACGFDTALSCPLRRGMKRERDGEDGDQ